MKNGLELCKNHRQETNQSHFDKHNCDFCKLQAEVERLRAELAVEREAVESLGNSFDKLRDEFWETKVDNTHWEESHDRIEAELAAAKANSEALKKALLEMQQAAIRLVGHIDEAKAELAAAKAASGEDGGES